MPVELYKNTNEINKITTRTHTQFSTAFTKYEICLRPTGSRMLSGCVIQFKLFCQCKQFCAHGFETDIFVWGLAHFLCLGFQHILYLSIKTKQRLECVKDVREGCLKSVLVNRN